MTDDIEKMDPRKLKDATMIYLLHWIHLTRKQYQDKQR